MMLLSPTPTLTFLSNKPPKPHFHLKPNKIITIILSSSRTSPQGPPPQQSTQNLNLYQPFRPPPSPLPTKFRSLDTASILDILTNRLGVWFEYALLIPTLVSEGFTPSAIEEITGIPGVEQNRLVVAAKVRETLVGSGTDEEIVAFFDNGGDALLYEIRLLSTPQRDAAARLMVKMRLDGKGAQELARAIKDFPRRRGEKGWESFNYTLPADCLAFMYYRQALEHNAGTEDWKTGLKQALEVAESEVARTRILLDLEGKNTDENAPEAKDAVKVPVVRMKVGEVGEATSVVVLPVCRGVEGETEVEAAPWKCGCEGEFGVVSAEKEWSRWVVLPGWNPIVGLKRGGVALEFADARILPWTVNRWYREEPVLVVADRGTVQVVADDGFYLVVQSSGGLKVERGSALKEKGVEKCLGMVLLVVRPPRDENDDQMSEEDWE